MWGNAVMLLVGTAIAGTFVVTKMAKKHEGIRYGKVFDCTMRLETFLHKHLNAQGRGLHAKINNVIDRLDTTDVDILRQIAAAREHLLQGSDCKIDPNAFDRLCKSIRKRLKETYGASV
ncbi:hypothetical protein [Hydrogenimonas urashimensis]|uniref:hypothetical protein n=1 Tax=Hydrogenimonas urashimensis TaxID=2740515 RepID=UPI001915E2CC|nr:hypothetical protein [Hydrogenimonas urashimensis]